MQREEQGEVTRKDTRDRREYFKRYRLEHLAQKREYYLRNRDRILEYGRRWRKAHPDYMKEYYKRLNENRK